MYKIVNDAPNFLKLWSDLSLCRGNKLQRFVSSLKNKYFFTNDVYDNIYHCRSKPARINGNPKAHKVKSKIHKLTFCIIVSSIDTYNYKLANFLAELLNPIIPSQHCATDSLLFCKEIQEAIAFKKFLISYDVCNFFTNIPLKEMIKLAVNLIFEKHPEIRITRKQLANLFEFTTSRTHFLFDGNYYDQMDGMAMESPLGPVLANLFMGYHEKIWLEEF